MRNAGYETLAGKRRLYGEWAPGYEGIPQPSPVLRGPRGTKFRHAQNSLLIF